MKLVLFAAGFLLVALAWAMVMQHDRYGKVRRTAVQDHQEILHSGAAFHVVSFLKLAPGADLFDAMRALRDATNAFAGARMIYAGKVLLNAASSSQLTEAFGEAVQWDALALVELPERSVYASYQRDAAVAAALGNFSAVYAHGMKRSALKNLLLPQLLLMKRIVDVVSFRPSPLPFEPAPRNPEREAQRSMLERLLSAGPLGDDAVLVANLTRRGSAEQRAADARYTGAMISLMAERGNGPMHMGDAVTLEGSARFDGVALVYYPGARYFYDMATSIFYQGIFGDKQLGDTQASITAPILDRL